MVQPKVKAPINGIAVLWNWRTSSPNGLRTLLPRSARPLLIPETNGLFQQASTVFPFGVEDTADRLEDRSIKYEMVVHAETNALMFAGEQANGCTLL